MYSKNKMLAKQLNYFKESSFFSIFFQIASLFDFSSFKKDFIEFLEQFFLPKNSFQNGLLTQTLTYLDKSFKEQSVIQIMMIDMITQYFKQKITMQNQQCLLTYVHKTDSLQHENHVDLVQNIQYVAVDAQLIDLYRNCWHYSYLICPHHVVKQDKECGILVVKWGKQLSSLSEAYLEAYVKETWFVTILRAYVELSSILPEIKLEQLWMSSQGDMKIQATRCCQEKEQYLNNFKTVVSTIFKSIPNIETRCRNINSVHGMQQCFYQFQEKKGGYSIPKLIQFKNSIPKIQKTHKIQLNEEEKEWIMTTINHEVTAKLNLVYDGEKNQFDPDKLLQVANKQQLLFVFQTTQGKRGAFWMAAKPEINPGSLFGTYYEDKSKKSLLLNLEKRSVHRLSEESTAVGFGKEILLSIGRVDLIFSAFNCSNVSYFPCSYAADEKKGVKTSEDFLGQQFMLKQFQAYRIN